MMRTLECTCGEVCSVQDSGSVGEVRAQCGWFWLPAIGNPCELWLCSRCGIATRLLAMRIIGLTGRTDIAFSSFIRPLDAVKPTKESNKAWGMYRLALRSMNDLQLMHECVEVMHEISKSTTNLASDCHWKIDACYRECQSIGRMKDIYTRSFQIADGWRE